MPQPTQPTQPTGKKHMGKNSPPPSRLRRILTTLGPGLITGASDDDPSGIVTYSQAGAQFGLSTLWTALLTFPLMAAMQGMAARIGLVTCQGLTGTLRQHYPKWVLYAMILFTFPAVILNIGADIQSMGAVANLLVPAIPSFSLASFSRHSSFTSSFAIPTKRWRASSNGFVSDCCST